MLWSLLSSIALFYGAAVVAQLEAQHQGRPDPQGAPTSLRSSSAGGDTANAAPGPVAASVAGVARVEVVGQLRHRRSSSIIPAPDRS
jgi:hypothetical protein